MGKALLSNRPRQYWQQRRNECGAYVMKALLNMYGRDGDEPPKAYLSFVGNLFSGFTWPGHIKKVLARHGLATDFRRALRPRKARLDILKGHLSAQEPVILLFGNSYSRMRKYYYFRRWFSLHWVLLLGFDDEKGLMYLYDPKVSSKYKERLPIGNVSLTYRKFMRQWRGIFLTGIRNYSYMPVRDLRK